MTEQVVPLSQCRPDMPDDLERIITKCLAKNRQDRYQDVTSLREALLACRSAGSWTRADAARWWQEPGRKG